MAGEPEICSIFLKKTAEDGFKNIATLLKAVPEAGAIHAQRFPAVPGEVRPTMENPEASIDGETHECTEMYPAFLKTAEEEKKTEAVQVFTCAMKAEGVHAGAV
ncbi:MAG: ferritin family protein [Methanoregula sp.]